MELGSGCNFLKGQLVQFPLYNYTFSDDQAVKEIMLHYSDSSSQKCNSPFSAWGLSSQAPPSAGTTRRADLRFVVHSNLIPIKMESASRRSRRARSISVALVYLSLSLPPPRCRRVLWRNSAESANGYAGRRSRTPKVGNYDRAKIGCLMFPPFVEPV